MTEVADPAWMTPAMLAGLEAELEQLMAAADMAAFTGRDGVRHIEQGTIELRLGPSSNEVCAAADVEIVGSPRIVGFDRILTTPVSVSYQS